MEWRGRGLSRREPDGERSGTDSLALVAGWILRAGLLVAAYYPAARLGLLFQFEHTNITPFWPPTGIALAALVLGGARLWPAVTLAAFLANVTTGLPPAVAAALAVGNTLEAVIGALLLTRVGFRRDLGRLRDVLALLVAGTVPGTLFAATVGVATLLASGVVRASSAWLVWSVYWVGDAMGALVVASLVLVWWRSPAWLRPTRRGIADAAVIALLLGAVLAWVMGVAAYPFLLATVVGWAAVRVGQAGATLATLVVSVVAVAATAHGFGPFTHGDLTHELLGLQLFIGPAALMGMALAAAAAERSRLAGRERVQAAELRFHEERTEFMNAAAHELRTPLAVLRGYLHLMTDGSLGAAPDGWRHPLEVSRDKADQMSNLIDDLLLASRTANGLVDPESRTVDLAALARQAASRAGPQADLRGGVLVASGGGEVLARADGALVARILDNLVDNALTYSTGPPDVRLETADGEVAAVVAIDDKGDGIPEDLHERVFEEFFRVDGGRGGPGGTGLGLYISRGLAAAMGGSLTIERSAPGHGSRFVLRLPRGGAQFPSGSPA